MNSRPVIYVFHGEDEFEKERQLKKLQAKLGDPSLVEMNTTRLDGKICSLGEVQNAISSVPFLTERRLVVLEKPFARMKSSKDRKSFLEMLNETPESTALVLMVPESLKSNHWFLNWAAEHQQQVYIRKSQVLKGGQWVKWIQKQARESGGEFSPTGAALLASLIGDDARQMTQEIEKNLAFVNYSRPVEADDVSQLTASVYQGDVFQLVDAIGNQQGKTALRTLQQLFADREPLSILGMIVRQFRLLIQAKEVQLSGGGDQQMAKQLKIHPYVAQKISQQARRFDLDTLEQIYHHLRDVDARIKTGETRSETALYTLVSQLTLHPQARRG